MVRRKRRALYVILAHFKARPATLNQHPGSEASLLARTLCSHCLSIGQSSTVHNPPNPKIKACLRHHHVCRG